MTRPGAEDELAQPLGLWLPAALLPVWNTIEAWSCSFTLERNLPPIFSAPARPSPTNLRSTWLKDATPRTLRRLSKFSRLGCAA